MIHTEEFMAGFNAAKEIVKEHVQLCRMGERDGDFRCIISFIRYMTPETKVSGEDE